MTWRSSTDVKDRIFGALVYLLPLAIALPFGIFLIRQFPVLGAVLLPVLQPILSIYSAIPFAGLIIFFVLLLGVVRNSRISHFIRFNTMQAILLDIIVFLIQIVFRVVSGGLSGAPLLLETLANVVFLGILAACTYSIIQSARGLYPDIPGVSDTAYNQVRF